MKYLSVALKTPFTLVCQGKNVNSTRSNEIVGEIDGCIASSEYIVVIESKLIAKVLSNNSNNMNSNK